MEENKKLNDLKNEAIEDNVPIMLDETSAYLAKLCSEKKPTTILEIGTAVGYSGTMMLLNSGNQAMLTTIEKDPKSFEKAHDTFREFDIEPRVFQYLGDAGEILPWLDENEKFDLVFLDGPKGQYLAYLPVIKKLMKKGATLVADDVNFLGLVKGEEKVFHKHRTIVTNLRAFIKTLESDSDFKTTVDYEIASGLLTAEKIK